MSTAPVVETGMRAADPRRLLVERAAVLLRRAGRMVGRAWTRWRRHAGGRLPASGGGMLGAAMSRALGAQVARRRMLAVEERLTLGPKQHMYVVRCGERRLLVASAGEAALQWMALPEENGAGSGNERDNRGARACGAESGAKRPTAQRAHGRSGGSGVAVLTAEAKRAPTTGRVTGMEGAR